MALDKEDIMALIAILQKGLTDDDEASEPAEDKVVVKQKTTKSPKTKATKQISTNKFDTMSERNMHKKDTLIDQKLWANLSVTDRTRQYTPVQVRCRSCGKTELVNPVLVDSIERYKCNRCSSSPG